MTSLLRSEDKLQICSHVSLYVDVFVSKHLATTGYVNVLSFAGNFKYRLNQKESVATCCWRSSRNVDMNPNVAPRVGANMVHRYIKSRKHKSTLPREAFVG